MSTFKYLKTFLCMPLGLYRKTNTSTHYYYILQNLLHTSNRNRYCIIQAVDANILKRYKIPRNVTGEILQWGIVSDVLVHWPSMLVGGMGFSSVQVIHLHYILNATSVTILYEKVEHVKVNLHLELNKKKGVAKRSWTFYNYSTCCNTCIYFSLLWILFSRSINQ